MMQYHVNSINFNDLPLDNNNCLYYYNDEVVTTQDAGLFNKNLMDTLCFNQGKAKSAHSENLHLEIYSETELWYVSFQLSKRHNSDDFSHYFVDGDKLFVYSSPKLLIYIYSLQHKKCLDIYKSHNFILNDKNFSYRGIMWQIIPSFKCLLTFNFKTFVLFDIHGAKWEVSIDFSYCKCCCYWNVTNEIVTVGNYSSHGDHHYNLQTGKKI